MQVVSLMTRYPHVRVKVGGRGDLVIEIPATADKGPVSGHLGYFAGSRGGFFSRRFLRFLRFLRGGRSFGSRRGFCSRWSFCGLRFRGGGRCTSSDHEDEQQTNSA
jgi:hypothetical protein